MWIVWMSQNGDEGPKNPSVSYQIQGLLGKMFRPAPAVILILPRYWIGLLTHLQHDNPKAQQSLAIPQLPNFLGPSVGYQLHPRHRDDVAQLRSCGENEDDQLAKVYFRSQESLVHVSQHPGTSWVTNRWQTGMISRKKKTKQWCVWYPWYHRLRLNALTWRDVQNAYMQGISKWLLAPLQPICYGFVDFCWSRIMNHESLRVAKQQNTSTSIQKLWKMMCPLGLCLLADLEPTKHSGPCWLNPSSFLCLWAGSPSTTKSGRSLEWINSIAGYGVLPEDTGDVTPLEDFEHPWRRFSKRRLKQSPFSSSVQKG